MAAGRKYYGKAIKQIPWQFAMGELRRPLMIMLLPLERLMVCSKCFRSVTIRDTLLLQCVNKVVCCLFTVIMLSYYHKVLKKLI